MIPPADIPARFPAPPHELGLWARLESKSATCEADLARLTNAPTPGWEWASAPVTESLIGWAVAFLEA